MRSKLNQILKHLVLIFIVILALLPFMNMITTSLIPNAYVLPSEPQIIPKQFYFGNYVAVWEGEDFIRYFLNSVFVTCITTVLTLIIASMSAYGFARLNFPGKNIIFNIYIFSYDSCNTCISFSVYCTAEAKLSKYLCWTYYALCKRRGSR